MADEYGYDYEPQVGGNYLRLKKRGDSIKIRLVSTPVHYQKEWEGKLREQFAWLAIDRADGDVKIFTAGISVYLTIKGFVQDEDWGDPTGYDLTITRIEESTANFYKVIPSPSKSPITPEELEKVKNSNLDLKQKFGNKGTKTFGAVKQGEELEEPPLPKGENEEDIDIDEVSKAIDKKDAGFNPDDDAWAEEAAK